MRRPSLGPKNVLQELKLTRCNFRSEKLAKQGQASNWGWNVPAKSIHFGEKPKQNTQKNTSSGGLETQCTLYCWSSCQQLPSCCWAAAFHVAAPVFQEMHLSTLAAKGDRTCICKSVVCLWFYLNVKRFGNLIIAG